MSTKYPSCIVCGKPGIPIGSVSGKDVVVCVFCAEPLHKNLSGLLEAMKVKPAKPTKPPAPKMTLEEFKEKLVEVVEKRGRASLRSICRWYGVDYGEAKKIAEALASEKGYTITKSKDKITIERPAPT